MKKSAKVGLISLGILLVLSLLFVIIILPLISAPDEPQIYYRTATTDVYKNPDGTYTTILYNEQVNLDAKDRRFPHYVLPNETFFQIIPSERTGYDFKLDDKYTKYQVYVRNNSNTEGAIRFEKDGYFFTYDLSGGQMLWAVSQPGKNDTDTLGGGAPSNSQNTQVTIDVNKANYSGAFYNTDAIYTMQMNMLKEIFILYGLPSYKDYLYLRYSGTVEFNKSLDVCANGVCYTPSGSEDDFYTEGRIDFRNSSGDTIFYLPSPTIIDSANKTTTGRYRFKGSNAHGIFYLYINKTWLQNAVYPIFIDPTVILDSSYYSGGIGCNDQPTIHLAIGGWIGKNPGNVKCRQFIQFNFSSFGDIFSVSNAQYQIYPDKLDESGPTTNISFYTINMSWTPSTVTWDNQPSYNSTPTYNISITEATDWNYFNATVTNNVNGWTNGSSTNYGWAIKTDEASGLSGIDWVDLDATNGNQALYITYTPYIDIISPTPSQIFTEDTATARFNITTAVAMDRCYWSNDTGTTNYTLTRLNASYFWLQNLTMVDGTHTIEFYCNQSDDNTWRTSDTVSFDVDSVNITRCRGLYTGRNYYLLNSLNAVDICLSVLDVDNVNVNCLGNSIYSNTDLSGDKLISFDNGIFAGSGSNTSLQNCNLNISYVGDHTLYIDVHSYPFVSLNAFNLINSTIYGNVLYDGGSFSIINSTIISIAPLAIRALGFGTFCSDSDGPIILSNSYFIGRVHIQPCPGIYFYINSSILSYNTTMGTIYSSNGVIYDSFLYNYTIIGTNSIVNAINTTIENQAISGTLTRKWYFDANVTDTNTGEKLQNVNITVKDLSGAVVISLLTDSNGDISRQELTEYINDGGTKTYKTSHNVSISKTGYQTNSTLINITTLTNIFYETNIEKNILGIKIFFPSNSTYNNRTAYFNVSVERNISLCRYTINSWANNYSLTRYNDSYYYASNTSIPDGSFRARFWCNDTNNVVNNTEYKDFSVDATPPLISYNSNTDSATYVNRNWIFINVTASDANKDTVRLDWSTIGNETFDNSGGNYYWENKTGLANGVYSFYVWINDSAGNKNITALRTITVDTIKPVMVFKYPTNTTYNINVSNLNYTYSDTNPSSCWYSLNIGITNSTAVTAGINWSNVVSIEGSNNYTIFCNDSANNINLTTLYFFKDTLLPIIINGTGTEESGANFSRTNIYMNVTVTESNEKNITFLLYKSGIINQTGFTTAIRAINWTGLSDGVYYYNVTVIDTSGNTNTSITRRISLDNTGPVVTIEHPKAQSYSTTNFSLNYTVSDATTYVSTCWYKVENSSIFLTISNTTIPCTNTTFNLTADGNYNLTFYANDSLNKLTTKVVAFSLSTALPSVVLDSPKENEWLKTTSITFNFTATDAHTFDNNCSLWGDWTGTWHKNYTWHIPNSGLQNYTTVILTEGGSYKYNVFCNESNGVASWGLTNVTFGIDQTYPQVKTVYPTNTTYTTTISVFNYTYSDTNPGSCWYSRDIGKTNSTSVLAGINFTGITSIEGSNNYTIFCNDTANNINSSTIYFTIESTPPIIAVVYPSNINYNINVSNLNYTYSDTNPASCWYSRDLGATNSTSIAAGVNWSNVKSNEGTNNYTLYCNDTSNLLSSSLVTFYKDTIFPQTNITYPQNITYNIELIYLNYTYSDTNPGSCWYSRDIGINNFSIVDAGFNFSYIASVESSNNWTLYCNDTFGNLNTTTLYFYKDMGLPLISIVYPENTTYVINVSNLNFTVSDINIESCWYSRNKSISNISITCGNNVSDIISVEENNTYTVWANDTSGNVNSHTINFLKDTILPEIIIIDPINGSVFSEYFINLTLNVSVNYSDITGYWWNYNDGVYNYSFTPNTTIAWTQMQDTTKTYILTIWVNDTHNNTAYNTSTFTMIVLKSGGISGGGGGGGGKVVTVEKIIKGAACGNSICEEGEYFYNCPQDCGQNLDTLFINCFSKDPIIRETCAWNKATALTWAFILTAVFVTIYIGRSLYKKYKKEKPKQIY